MSAENPIASRWWMLGRGDIDATVAQVGFNLAQMIIPVFLLAPIGIPLAFSIDHLVPGYALGFLLGSLGLTFLAVRLRKREERADVTAHVYGNNVPAIIAYTLSIVLPVLPANARRYHRVADRGCGGCVDRDHQAGRRSLCRHVPALHPDPRLHDRFRSRHVQLFGARAAAANLRPAPGGNCRTRHCCGECSGEHSDHALAHTALYRGVDHSPGQSAG